MAQSIKIGRPVSYTEYCRIWDRYSSRSMGSPVTEIGTFISPSGDKWRPCGLHYPGMLLVNWGKGLRHSVAIATLIRLQHCWTWHPDNSNTEISQFKISQWPNGTHYYVIKPDGDPLPGKWNTFGEAYAVAMRWSKKQQIA